MKILQVTSTFSPLLGGQEKIVLELSKRLIKLGHEVTVLTSDFLLDGKFPEEDKIGKIKIFRFKNNLFLGGYGFSWKAFWWLINNYKNYDIIHLHGYNRFLTEIPIFFLKNKVPLIFTPAGFIHTKKNYVFKLVHDLTVGKIIRFADICTALTELDYKDYKRIGIDKNKIRVVPCGVDLKKFNNVNRKRISLFKRKHRLDKKTILFVGRIHESKGLQYLVQAIKDIDCKLLIVGKDAGFKNKIISITKKLGISEKIIFAGGLSDNDLITSYYSSDVFVLFSEWEGFGITVIEAMASGKPVIVSNRGSLPYLVKNNDNGFVVKYPSIKKLELKIKELLSKKKERGRIGKKAKEFSKQFDWDDITKKYESIYRELKKNGI